MSQEKAINALDEFLSRDGLYDPAQWLCRFGPRTSVDVVVSVHENDGYAPGDLLVQRM
jgi:hypothetical protein